MSGVFGVFTSDREAASITQNALLSLQHRGQQSAGVAALNGSDIVCQKGVGLALDVFSKPSILPREARFAIGHVRYSGATAGEAQGDCGPHVAEYLRGRAACAHSGRIVNFTELRRRLADKGCTFTAGSDSEIIALSTGYEALLCDNLETAVARAARKMIGSFSLVFLGHEGKIVALRDAWGFKPLCIGESDTGYAVASESCALDGVGFKFIRDIEPGEMVVIDAIGIRSEGIILHQPNRGLCIFEYVYFARSDSVIDGQSVYDARHRMGAILAREHPVDADVVCGVPESGLDAAAGYSQQSGIPAQAGFVKNRYMGRSFIYPTQSQREAVIQLKLNPLVPNVRGKRIALVDDSIVRGTTCAKIVSSLKAAGAKEVHVRISSPPFQHACHFGVDVDSRSSLIANGTDVEGIRRIIGAESLGFISDKGLREACSLANLPMCDGCLSGEYPVDVDEIISCRGPQYRQATL